MIPLVSLLLDCVCISAHHHSWAQAEIAFGGLFLEAGMFFVFLFGTTFDGKRRDGWDARIYNTRAWISSGHESDGVTRRSKMLFGGSGYEILWLEMRVSMWTSRLRVANFFSGSKRDRTDDGVASPLFAPRAGFLV